MPLDEPFAPEQVVMVFRSGLGEPVDPRYDAMNAEVFGLAERSGGLIDAKTFVADDGEHCTVVTFADRASHERWASDERHREAQRLGASDFYATYSVQVADCTRVSGQRPA